MVVSVCVQSQSYLLPVQGVAQTASVLFPDLVASSTSAAAVTPTSSVLTTLDAPVYTLLQLKHLPVWDGRGPCDAVPLLVKCDSEVEARNLTSTSPCLAANSNRTSQVKLCVLNSQSPELREHFAAVEYTFDPRTQMARGNDGLLASVPVSSVTMYRLPQGYVRWADGLIVSGDMMIRFNQYSE